jgi:hypothetical protein
VSKRSQLSLLLCSFLLGAPGPLTAAEPDAKQLTQNIKEIAGTAEFLRSVPKRFATLQAVDGAQQRVTLLLEGESAAKTWPLVPDAEIKVAGWWGRLDQLAVGDRVWIWFKTDRKKQPVAISMLADELSEQDIHGKGSSVEAIAADKVTVKPNEAAKRTLGVAGAQIYRGKETISANDLQPGQRIYVQSAGDKVRLVLDPAAFEARRLEQKAALRKRWSEEGLPGTVAFLHIFSGEMDYMLDHEAMRWGRSLKPGDKVTLRTEPPIAAVVRHVQPWRERTQLRLVVNGIDQADLTLGQRVRLGMSAPPEEVDTSVLPPDVDRPRSKEERVEWFLATIYCTCKVNGDICTGMFYTLASCNPNGCGMPNYTRKLLAEKIDKGMKDREILEEMLKESGPELLRPHLLR